MTKEKIAKVTDYIIYNRYSGYSEGVIYAGMPSKDSFSIIYETANMEERNSNAMVNIQQHRQFFFPVNHSDEISFPSISSCKFKVKNISPTELVAIIEED